MITIISSTNRKNSVSAKVAEFYLKEFVKRNIQAQVVKLEDLPHDFTFSSLYENSGKNDAFNIIRDKVQSSDKLLFVIPEYNGSFPGVLKAFIDGLKFPLGLKNKKAAMVGISSGAMGGALAISGFTDVLNYLGCHVFALKPRITFVEKNFDGERVLDDAVQKFVLNQIAQFIEF